jgi:hypothetical protein
MAQIQGIQIWNDGIVKTAEQFNLRSIADDLSSSATFYYELKEADVVDGDNVASGQILRNGNLSMGGAEYNSWDDSNASAYTWAAGKLNIILV